MLLVTSGSTSVTAVSRIGQLSMFCSQAYGAGNYALVGSLAEICCVLHVMFGLFWIGCRKSLTQ